MFELITVRLILRQFQAGDAEALHAAIFSNTQVMHLGDGPRSLDWTRSWIQTCRRDYYESRGYGPYAVVEREFQDLIGYCGLFYFPDVNGKPEVEIGYRFTPSAWGQGYATEAALAVKEYAYSSLRIKRLIAIIDPAYVASIRVAEKIGMHYEQDVMFDGYTHSDRVYAITQA